MPRPWWTAFWASLGYGILLLGALVAAMAYYPQFAENIGKFKALAPLAVLKNLVGELEEGGLWAYVAGQQFFKGCNTLGTAAAVLFAAGAVAGEANRGTMEIWLARPISRTRLLWTRYAAGAAALIAPVFWTTWTIPLQMRIFDVPGELSYGLLTLAALHQSALLLAIYSVTFACSCNGRHPLRIAFVVLFLTTLQFALYLVEQLTHYSLFRLTDVQHFMAIAKDGLDPALVLPLVGVSALSLGIGWWLLRRRLPL